MQPAFEFSFWSAQPHSINFVKKCHVSLIRFWNSCCGCHDRRRPRSHHPGQAVDLHVRGTDHHPPGSQPRPNPDDRRQVSVVEVSFSCWHRLLFSVLLPTALEIKAVPFSAAPIANAMKLEQTDLFLDNNKGLKLC